MHDLSSNVQLTRVTVHLYPYCLGIYRAFHGNEVESKPPENDRMPCVAEILSELWLYKALSANRHK